MKTLFSKLNAAIVNPLMAPPVPSRPAESPENDPPIIAFFVVGKTTIFFPIRKIRLNPTRKIPKMISNTSEFMTLDNNPPTITKMTDGIPMEISNRLSSPCLKRKILLRLLERWNIAVRPKTE